MGEGEIGALRDALDRIAQGRRPPAAAAAPDRTDAEAMPSPLGAVETGPPDASPDPTEAPSAAPKRALLVAADPAERDLTRAMLQHCGVTVTVADDAAAAADTAYDLIVIDRPLPGNALLAGQRPPGRGGRPVPAIVLGVADGGDTPEGFVPGVDARLKRPFSFFDLHAELSRIFGES
jgi:CheY-like chemotaxis protein